MAAATGYINQAELAKAVEQAAQALGPEVVRLKYVVQADTSGDPAIYFRIVLADWATAEETIAEVTGKIEDTLFDSIHPLESWGLIPYTSFRSDSEQGADREWA